MKIGIVGYGNLGRGCEIALAKQKDMSCFGVFTRRNPSDIKTVYENTKVYSMSELNTFKNEIDCLILCGGSANDLLTQSKQLAADFNIVDSFDTHALALEHVTSVNSVAKNTTAIVCVGWDPGLFSLQRAHFDSLLTDGDTITFWGNGVSQGHSQAVKSIDGVKLAVQYTIVKDDARDAFISGEKTQFTTAEKHRRECYVVVEEDGNKEVIEQTIKTMKHYFSDYDTTVHFIDEAEFMANHMGKPHGGEVIRRGKTSDCSATMRFSLQLDSNPEFTSSVLVGYARACVKMASFNQFGAKTVFDVPVSYCSTLTQEELIKGYL